MQNIRAQITRDDQYLDPMGFGSANNILCLFIRALSVPEIARAMNSKSEASADQKNGSRHQSQDRPNLHPIGFPYPRSINQNLDLFTDCAGAKFWFFYLFFRMFIFNPNFTGAKADPLEYRDAEELGRHCGQK